MFRTLIICSLFLSFITSSYAAPDLIGNWITADKTIRYDFLEGFAPKRGVVIQYKDAKPKSIKKWEIRPNGVKIGWSNKKYQIHKDIMILDGKKFKKLPITSRRAILDLKKDPQVFIDTLVDSNWTDLIEKKIFQYKKGFSSTSGIYSITKKGKQGNVGSWSFANGVIKIDRNVYPNGRIAGDLLFLLTSRDKIEILRQGKKSQSFKTVELKKKGKEFIRKLVTGRWMEPGSYGKPDFIEYRPIFGDLSGVIFKFDGSDFIGSRKWEYSLKTGSIKIGYTEFPNAQIQGPFLILLKKDGTTEQTVRPQNEKSKVFTNSQVRRVKVTETDTQPLKKLLERQWYNRPNTYTFVFEKNGKEGWLHQFRSYPFVVSGNTLNIKGHAKVTDIRFLDGKIVLGDNKKSYFEDSKFVYLTHQNIEAAATLSKRQKQKTQEDKQGKLVLKIKTRSGGNHQIVLPVSEMKNIVSLSVEPGL